MAVRFIVIQTLLCFVSYTTLAEKSSAQSIVVVLGRPVTGAAGNADPTCLVGILPVVRRDDYTYFPGIGGYKLHTRRVRWNQARITCEEEGGHLAVINSVAERDAMLSVIKAKTPVPECISIGFHDLYEEGHYITIHEQTLARAGFNEWARGEPNNRGPENCGSLYPSGGLNDHGCEELLPFICEQPIR